MTRLAVLAFCNIAICHASVILGTNLPSLASTLTISDCCFLSQPFTLKTAINVASINVQVAGTGTYQTTVWLTDKVGPGTTASDVLFQSTQIFPDNGGGVSGETVSLPINQNLSSGTYYLIMSTSVQDASGGPAIGWLLSTSTLSSTVGSVGLGADSCCSGGSTNTAFAPASTFMTGVFGEGVFAFQIDGTVILPPGEPLGTPEPATVFILGAGLLFFSGLRFRNG